MPQEGAYQQENLDEGHEWHEQQDPPGFVGTIVDKQPTPILAGQGDYA